MQWICAWTFLKQSHDGSISRIIYNESTDVTKPDFTKLKINERLNCLAWWVINKKASCRLLDSLNSYQLQMLFRDELYTATRKIRWKLWELKYLVLFIDVVPATEVGEDNCEQWSESEWSPRPWPVTSCSTKTKSAYKTDQNYYSLNQIPSLHDEEHRRSPVHIHQRRQPP